MAVLGHLARHREKIGMPPSLGRFFRPQLKCPKVEGSRANTGVFAFYKDLVVSIDEKTFNLTVGFTSDAITFQLS